jgi:type III restriction enzyme
VNSPFVLDNTAREIAQRLSLRTPQREALGILCHALKRIDFERFLTRGSGDANAALEMLQPEFEMLSSFEREFVSLCFALATGVGKTRLMGAFVAYLHLVYGVRNFFVLAPNLTIYNKLIQDFTPGTRKYVLKGLARFANEPPLVITGDNYAQTDWSSAGFFTQVRINVFNISKINSEVRGGKEPRIKQMQEVLGEGYFQYLSSLPDLVLLMDESHRYRASAGVRAINELRPVLGLELTATPFVTPASGPISRFKNIVQDYPLGRALEDGFVKEPVVVTRKDFSAAQLSEAELEHIKLEDGIRLHERVKVDLDTYHRQTGEPLVKPFILVIARDTTHASALRELIQTHEYFTAYREKVIQVDSSQSEELMIERLLKIEDPNEPTEIVIHVNMLKEGWDVTNLYTIVPLRAANARVLIEQTIGRGLRLPYGRRVSANGLDEYKAVDRLSIIAHDKFQEIVDEANKPGSLLRMQTLELTEDDLRERTRTVEAKPNLETMLGLGTSVNLESGTALDSGSITQVLDDGLEQPASTSSIPTVPNQNAPMFTPEEQRIARTVLAEIETLGKKRDSGTTSSLLQTDVQARLVAAVQRRIAPSQSPLEFGETPATITSSIASVVARTAAVVVENTISIPRIMVVPVGDVRIEYSLFILDLSGLQFSPASTKLLVQSLQTNQQEFIGVGEGGLFENRAEDSIVNALVTYNDIDYLTQSEILYDLAEQVVRHLQESSSHDETQIRRIVQDNQKQLGRYIYTQMRAHRREAETEYEPYIGSGFVKLKANAFTTPFEASVLAVTQPPMNRDRIGQLIYGHFKRCLYPVTKFQSDQERLLAGILERDSQKWFKPVLGQFSMQYRLELDPREYQPDFVAELENVIVMLEVKAADKMTDPVVLEKKRVAELWCQHASAHALEHGGKPWRYHLIAHDLISSNMSLERLMQVST